MTNVIISAGSVTLETTTPNLMEDNPMIGTVSAPTSDVGYTEPLLAGDTTRNESFPLDALPSVMRNIVKEIAMAHSVPEPFVAYPALSHGAAAIGNSAEVRCYADGGTEAPILWTGVIASSGIGKTEVLKKLRNPFEAIEQDYSFAYQEECEQYQQDKEDGTCGIAPVEKNLLVEDATMESIFVMCSKNPHGLLLSESEGKLFFSFDRYRMAKTDEANYCKLYDRSYFKINRKSAAPITGIGILNLAMMIQPGNFGKALKANHGMMTSGLLARMNLCCPVVGEFCIAQQVNAAAYKNWDKAIEDVIGRRTDSSPVQVSLESKAKATWDQYMTACRNLARKTHGWLGGYYDRLHVTAIRLALQFHYFEGGGNVMNSSVVERGIAVAQYMKAQNERVAEMFAGVDVDGGLTDEQKDVMRVLRKYTPATEAELKRQSRVMRNMDLGKVLQELVKVGQIQDRYRDDKYHKNGVLEYTISNVVPVAVADMSKNTGENRHGCNSNTEENAVTLPAEPVKQYCEPQEEAGTEQPTTSLLATDADTVAIMSKNIGENRHDSNSNSDTAKDDDESSESVVVPKGNPSKPADGYVSIFEVPFCANDRSCYRQLKYSSVEFRGKVFPACDINKLYSDIVQELWKENRENVIEANGRMDGGIQGIGTKEQDKKHKPLDSEYTLYTGFIPRYCLQSLRSLHEPCGRTVREIRRASTR